MMAEKGHIPIFIIIFTVIKFCFSIDDKDLHNWHAKIIDQKFSCPVPKESYSNLSATQALFKVVDCDEPSALYRYDFKVSTLWFLLRTGLSFSDSTVCLMGAFENFSNLNA